MDKQLRPYLLLPINAEKRELITLFGIYICNSIDFFGEYVVCFAARECDDSEMARTHQNKKIYLGKEKYIYKMT